MRVCFFLSTAIQKPVFCLGPDSGVQREVGQPVFASHSLRLRKVNLNGIE